MRRRSLFCSAMLLILQLLFFPAMAKQAHIASASNFSHTMRAIQALFEAETEYQLLVSYGSSGKLYAQITHGAPFHVFLSADTEKPEALIKQRKAVPESLFTYAVGRLYLWRNRSGKLPFALQTLNTGDFHAMAIANPKLAPYGQAAMQVLNNLRFSHQDKLVFGENIAQTFQFVQSGNAELGFVAAAQITQYQQQAAEFANSTTILVPQTLHDPIQQNAVLLRSGKHNPAAIAFVAYLQSDAILQLIAEHGYDGHLTPPTQNR